MVCKLCKSREKRYAKILNGKICENCFDSFPQIIQDDIELFSSKQLLEMRKIIRKPTSKYWAKCGNVKICEENIQFSDWEISFRDLNKVYLNFHIDHKGLMPNSAVGSITVVMETKNPDLKIEEFCMETCLKYRIHGKGIVILYPSEFTDMFNAIQKSINSKTYNIRMYKTYTENSKKERTMGNPSQEELRRRQSSAKRTESGRKQTKMPNYVNTTEFEKAKALYEVEFPYTEEDIKKRRNKLLKQLHPDEIGGNNELCAQINNAYDLLIQYAI